MSAETQNNAKANNPFGDKKVTQAEVAMFVQQALQPLVQRLLVLNNAIDVLYNYLAEVGIGGDRVTQAEIIAFAQSKNNGAQKSNGTNS